ncbi:hypothetical protein NDU88_000145 [Pleurodeles waltl]|uniref:Uncharacterized protein n=1 Tax=Pleurodeles waltl TaxID=8319 RepID=A0AAV7S7D0_PLEWA|nr:hypothetical protein NDU88_000145 [Pleurodeles waltl]
MGTGLRGVSSKLKIAGAQPSRPNLLRLLGSYCIVYLGGCPGSLFSLLPLSLFLPGGGSFVLRRPDPGAEGHSPHSVQLRPTRLKRGSPQRTAHLFGASIVTFISPGRGTPSQSRRLFSCGGLQITGPSPGAPCITRGSLAHSGLLSRLAPVPGPGRTCPNQAGEPPSQGSPSLGFSSVPRSRRHGARVPEDQRSRPRRSSTHWGPQVTARSRHFTRRTRHSHRRRPCQRAGPDPRARRDAISPDRHLWKPIDSVTASVHGSGCVGTGTGGISEVRELAGTAMAA